MTKFRVLRGIHSEGGVTYEAGGIVDSSTNLLRMNSPGSVKFVKVGQEPVLASASEPLQSPDQLIPTAGDSLDAMTVAELREFAREEGIDLEGANRKDQIIEAIRAATQEA